MNNNERRKGDLVWCDRCNKYIIYYLETRVVKLQNWDLLCIHCDNWIGGMRYYYGWEIGESDKDLKDIEFKEPDIRTMGR